MAAVVVSLAGHISVSTCALENAPAFRRESFSRDFGLGGLDRGFTKMSGVAAFGPGVLCRRNWQYNNAPNKSRDQTFSFACFSSFQPQTQPEQGGQVLYVDDDDYDNDIIVCYGNDSFKGKSLTDFIRVSNSGDGAMELQTAVTSYRKRFPFNIFQPTLQVDLVAAVHIADKEYFSALQKELAQYDRVLYEMVADKNPRQTNRNAKTRWRPPRRLPGARSENFSFVSFVQRFIASLLRLDFQLECMDYRKDNWYHADFDFQTFQKLQDERGENLMSLARDMAVISSKAISKLNPIPKNLDPWRAKLLWTSRAFPMPLIGLLVINSLCSTAESPLLESPEVKALMDLNIPSAFKAFLAKQLTAELPDDAVFLVENSVIIGERNRVAMDELREALREGCKRVAIFYGAGHMPDMDYRLQEEFGLVPKAVQWRSAWSIRGRKLRMEGWISSRLESLAKLSGWQFNRYQTLALIMLSMFLAVDLWLWEICFDTLSEYGKEVVTAVVHFLDQGWEL